jgi:hypothetical protein
VIFLQAVRASCFQAIVVSIALILSYTAFLEGATVVTQSQDEVYGLSLTIQPAAPDISLNLAILSLPKNSYVLVLVQSSATIFSWSIVAVLSQSNAVLLNNSNVPLHNVASLCQATVTL